MYIKCVWILHIMHHNSDLANRLLVWKDNINNNLIHKLFHI